MTDLKEEIFLHIFNNTYIGEDYIRHTNASHDVQMADIAIAYHHYMQQHPTYRHLSPREQSELYSRIREQVELEYMKELL